MQDHHGGPPTSVSFPPELAAWRVRLEEAVVKPVNDGLNDLMTAIRIHAGGRRTKDNETVGSRIIETYLGQDQQP